MQPDTKWRSKTKRNVVITILQVKDDQCCVQYTQGRYQWRKIAEIERFYFKL